MSEKTLPQRHPVQRDKQPHPAGVGDRWSVSGEYGRVVYDVLGNHLALIDANGDIDSVMGRTLARVSEYARLDDDDAVFAVLADLYRTDLAGAPAAEPTNPDRCCRRCGATSGLKMLHRNPLTLAAREWECWDGCTGGTR